MKNSARRKASATRQSRPTRRRNIYPRPIPELSENNVVALALAEDVGDGDVTTAATVPSQARARAMISQKAPGVIYGLEVAIETFRALDPDLVFQPLVEEGEWREQRSGAGPRGLEHAGS